MNRVHLQDKYEKNCKNSIITSKKGIKFGRSESYIPPTMDSIKIFYKTIFRKMFHKVGRLHSSIFERP